MKEARHKETFCIIPLTWGTQRSQIHRKRNWKGRCQELGTQGMESCYLTGIKCQLFKRKRVLGISCTTTWMYLPFLNWTLKNAEDGKSYAGCILPQLRNFKGQPHVNPAMELYPCLSFLSVIIANLTTLVEAPENGSHQRVLEGTWEREIYTH